MPVDCAFQSKHAPFRFGCLDHAAIRQDRLGIGRKVIYIGFGRLADEQPTCADRREDFL
jgi:hypothetical protein